MGLEEQEAFHAIAETVADEFAEMLKQEEDAEFNALSVFGMEISTLMVKKGAEGKPDRAICNVENAVHILSEHRETAGLLAFDELQGLIVLQHPVPRGFSSAAFSEREIPKKWAKPRPLTDADYVDVQRWLQRGKFPSIGLHSVIDAVNSVARMNSFHPILDYLKRLKWDGVERVSGFGSTYLGAEDSAYTRKVFEIFFISAVARVYEPGCKADYMLILEGKQGLGKSTLFSKLAGDWFSDSLPGDVSSKDAADHVAGKWIIEMAEMHSLRKSEADALKQFITKTTEKFRPAYGRCEVVRPRSCVFVGTTNEEGYLKDLTGNRRFLPVKVERVDVEGMEGLREQLWAEAVVLYRRGVRWWPDRDFEEAEMKPQQEERLVQDPWAEIISSRLRVGAILGDGVMVGHRIGFQEIGLLLELPQVKQNDFHQKRIRAVMERLGWKYERKSHRNRFVSPQMQKLEAEVGK